MIRSEKLYRYTAEFIEGELKKRRKEEKAC